MDKKPVVTIEQATKVRDWATRFARSDDHGRLEKIKSDALAERAERTELLAVLAEANVQVRPVLNMLKEVIEFKLEEPPKWSDKIRAAEKLLDFFKYLATPTEGETPGTTTRMSIRFEDLSVEEAKFYATFGRLPTATEVAGLEAVRGQKALPSSHTSEETEKVLTSGSHHEDNK